MTDTRAASRRPTLEMVAREAGVTRSTVSRVVNGEPDVSAATVALVRDAIAKLNYVPNRAARSLASNRTMAIALVIPETSELFLADPHLAAVMAGASKRLEETDYVLNLLVSSGDRNGKLMRYLTSGSVDGALVASQHAKHDYLLHLHDVMPVVFGGRPSEPTEPPNYFVDVDNRTAAQLATEHLIAAGRRRIGTLTGSVDMQAALDRVDGWRSALAGAGLMADAIEHADFTAAGATAAMQRLLARVPELDAVFVASDLMANAAIEVLRAHGRTVPADVAVVGFDDSSAALAGPVPLTTIRQPSFEMGVTMVEQLLRLLKGEEAEVATIMPSRLVVRASA